MSNPVVAFLAGTGVLFGYYLLMVGLVPVLLLSLTSIPRELARKLHHVFYGFSIFILLEGFGTWYLAVLATGTLIVVAYPVLRVLERQPFFEGSFAHRKGDPGDFRRQMVHVQLTFALLLALTWGVLGPEFRYLAAAAVMAWTFGDAAAALFGKAFGKNRIEHQLVDEGKTHEGSASMTAFAFVAIFLTLWLYGGVPWWASGVAALVVAPLATGIEAISPAGTDTVTVPLVSAAALYPLLSLLEWFAGRA